MPRHTIHLPIALIFLLLFLKSAQSVKLYQSFFQLTNYYSQFSSSNIQEKIIVEQDLIKMIETSNTPKKNITIHQENLYSNMIVTPKYALMGKCNSIFWGVLKKLNFQTMKLQTVTFKRPFIGFSYYMLQIADLKNGEIAVGEGTYLYIFDNQTLKLKQTLNGSQMVGQISLSYQGKVCMIKRGSDKIFELKKDVKSGKYFQILASYDFQAPFNTFPTGDKTAVTINTIRGCEVSYWNNDEPILKLSYDPKDYLSERIAVAVSYSESFFVVRNKWNNQYEFYNLEDNYQITLFQSILIDNNTYQRGQFTNDDNTLFISTINTNTKQNYIAKIDIKTQSLKFISDNEEVVDNQIDFNLFDSRKNRIVTLVSRNQNYYLQLRLLDELIILDQYLLDFDFSVKGYKLVGSISWDYSFSVVAKVTYQKVEYDSRIFLFSIEGDKIINLNVKGQVSYQFVQASYKYVITNKKSFQTLKIINYQDFSLATQIYSRNINDNAINIEKNILTFTQYFGGCYIYDLEQSIQRKSILYKDSQRRIMDRFVSIIFPKKGLFYETPQRQYSINEVTKAVYDISKTSVSKIFKLNGQLPCESPTYFIPRNSQNGEENKCGYIYYVELDEQHLVHHLVRYSQCSQQLDKFLISDIDSGTLSQLFISSDSKYIIMLLHRYPIPNILLEIRPISNLNEVVHHQIFELRSQRDTYAFWFNADLINDTMILIHGSYYVSVTYIQPKIMQGLEEIQK